jgi:hypothetical protein
MAYPNISDHGLIGDLQTAALVTTPWDPGLVLLSAVLTRRTCSRLCWMPGAVVSSGSRRRHLSLISAAINLDRQLDHGPGSV